MKNIIVITGGAGFIGSNLVEFLIKKTNFKIISLDNYFSGSIKNHLNNKRVKYLKGSTVDINKILSKYKKKISVIFHFGEFSRIYQSFEIYDKCMLSNVHGTAKVINFCKDNNIKLIYSATSSCLGDNGRDANLSPYAWSKFKNIEHIFNMRQWFNLEYEIIYFYNVYGPRQIMNSKMSAVVGVYESNLKKNHPMPVVKPGTQLRNFTHVYDTVKVCYDAWKKNKNLQYSIYSTESIKIVSLAKMFSDKIIYKKPRRGERWKSSIVKKILGKKIINIKAKIKIRDYIKTLKK